jgi:hypothetical protein
MRIPLSARSLCQKLRANKGAQAARPFFPTFLFLTDLDIHLWVLGISEREKGHAAPNKRMKKRERKKQFTGRRAIMTGNQRATGYPLK